MTTAVVGFCAVVALLTAYLAGWQHGKRTMAQRVRGEGVLCWRCDGSGHERREGAVLR